MGKNDAEKGKLERPRETVATRDVSKEIRKKAKKEPLIRTQAVKRETHNKKPWQGRKEPGLGC